MRHGISLTTALLILPLIVMLGLLYSMVIWTIYVSFSDWKGTRPNYSFAGLKWYFFMARLDRFWVDLKNNFLWFMIGVPPTALLAMLVAYLLEIASSPKLESYLRNLVLYPASMSFVVTGTIWSWMYEPSKGVINTLLRSIGLSWLQQGFTTDPNTAIYWLIVIFIWQYFGFSLILFQTALRTSMIREMIEAASVDGASQLRILFSIIAPNIKGGLLTVISLLLISALKVFDIVYIVTFGAPGYSTDVLAFHMYIATFQQHLVALGAALATIIFVLALVIVIPYTVYALKRWFG